MRINFYSLRLGVWMLTFVGILALSSCLRDNLEPINGDLTIRVKVMVPIETPSTRSRVIYDDNGNNVGPEIQRYVNDVYALIFNEDGTSLLYSVKMSLVSGDNMDETQTYDASIVLDETLNATMWIVTNLEQNGFSTTEVQELVGKSKEEVQAALVFPYDYTENTDGLTLSGWDITQHSLPMWGEAISSSGSAALTLDPQSGNMIYVYANMYRAVAKMGFTIDMEEGDEYGGDEYATFNLREVYVYYAQDNGAVAPAVGREPDSEWQYLVPDVPSSSSTLGAPIKYDLGEGIYNGEEWFNEIFLAECDNSEAPSTGLVLVLGGIYAPEGVSDEEEMSYYRVDIVYEDGTTVDVIRNHSYIFRIVGIESVGTSDPDPDRATDGLIVEIEDYTEEEMKGINSQYTLTVNKSAFAFNAIAVETNSLEIETDGTTWNWDNGVYYRGTDTDGVERYFVYIVTDENGNMTVYDGETLEPLTLTGTANENGLFIETIGGTAYVFYEYSTTDGVEYTVLVNWLNITAGAQNTDTSGTYEYTAEPNVGIWEFNRYAYLYITAGSIRKQIQFAQPVGESANSTVITKAGTYAFNATERGNGGTAAERDDGSYDEGVNFAFSTTLNKEDVNSVGLIWETSDGLVTVEWDDAAQELFAKTGCVKYTVNNVRMYTPDGQSPQTGYWSGSVFDEGNGGNALIGAFDLNNQLLWSWHVWVVPDYFDGVKTELWGTGYEFMDRNLGAYSNLPGSKSFGLLYQWGRKDPFIGAYREDRERDYHTVPKQYTKMYINPYTGSDWYWDDFNDSVYGNNYDGEEAILEYTVHYPTTILDNGLLSEEHSLTSAHGLWGAETTDVEDLEHGSKTMWDPCPEGYRVPTLNALTIYDGVNDMWTSSGTAGVAQTQHAYRTLRYVPIVNDGASNAPWQTGGATSTFVSDAPFYGFWLEYGDWGGTGTFASTYSTSYGVGYYDTTNDPYFSSFGYIDDYVGSKPDWATWLPLAGIYNGSMDHFGRAGMTDQGPEGNPYLPASSLHVTSVLWGNSPTDTNSNYPGGLLLHGTEGAYALHNGNTMYEYSAGTANGSGGGNSSSVATEGEGYWTNEHSGASNTAVAWWTGSDSAGQWNYNGTYVTQGNATWSDENGMPGSGRHFHSFADPTISTLANPSYAASVRCIVDKARLNANANVIYEADGTTTAAGKTYNLYQYEGTVADYTTFELNFTIYSIESWQVSNPGAKWISVSPMNGNTADAYGSSEVLTVKYNSGTTTVPQDGEGATITIKFLSGSTQTIAISYAGEYYRGN